MSQQLKHHETQVQISNQHNNRSQQKFHLQKNSTQFINIQQSVKIKTNIIFWISISFFSIILISLATLFLYAQNIGQAYSQSNFQLYTDSKQIVYNFNQQYQLIKLNSTSALCLDGSKPAYLLSKSGDPSKLLIHMTGGAWCTHGGTPNEQVLIQNCYERSKIYLGTSNYTSNPTMLNQGLFGNHPNNYFKDWKRVYFYYCDGTGHQGTRKQPVNVNGSLIYFRGYNITTERFDDLDKRLGLYNSIKNVVLTGDSAGGIAVLQWANYLQQKVKGGQVKVIADASVFIDGYNKILQRHDFRESFGVLMKYTDVEVSHPLPECVKQFPNNQEKCMFAQHLYKYIKVPLFAINSLYDNYGLPWIYGMFCIGKTFEKCSAQDLQVIENNRQSVMGVLKQIAKDKRNGVWGFGCLMHETLIHDYLYDLKYTVPLNSKYTIMESIKMWMQIPDGDNVHLDDEVFSNIKQCP